MRLRAAALLGALFVVGCSHGHARPTVAFGHLIKNRYGEQQGIWRCASGYDKGQLECYGEVHRGSRYRSPIS